MTNGTASKSQSAVLVEDDCGCDVEKTGWTGWGFDWKRAEERT
jgi:hypothetical protein